jgi:uncharacterized protein YqeY
MSLNETLRADMKSAMKAREKERLGTLRLLVSALQYELIAADKPLEKKDEINFLAREAKRRRESITAYEAAGRNELAEKEAFELAVIKEYLPQQLAKEDVETLVRKAAEELGAATMADMGKVMGKVMPQLRGRFPGQEVRPIVEALLRG